MEPCRGSYAIAQACTGACTLHHSCGGKPRPKAGSWQSIAFGLGRVARSMRIAKAPRSQKVSEALEMPDARPAVDIGESRIVNRSMTYLLRRHYGQGRLGRNRDMRWLAVLLAFDRPSECLENAHTEVSLSVSWHRADCAGEPGGEFCGAVLVA